jgi:hypothetical protein
LSPNEARFLHVSTALVGASGLVYGWMLYFAEPADEFSVVNHRWQPDVQHLHILVAPLLVFACALVWRDHVWHRVRSGFAARRPTGLALFALVWPMIASGYLVQVSVDEGWRNAWIVLHVASSCLWLAAYAIHQLSPRGTS